MEWKFAPLDSFSTNFADVSPENFTQEEKDLDTIFWREFLQNFIDVPSVKGLQKKLNISLIPDTNLPHDSILDKHVAYLEPRLKAAKNFSPFSDEMGTLVLDEINTVGLEGDYINNRIKGEGEYWNNFWHTEGKSTKTGAQLGRKGQGKVTYHEISKVRTVYAITKRESDSKQLLFGKCRLTQTFNLENKDYQNNGYFTNPSSDKPAPSEDETIISNFTYSLNLHTREHNGTTWIIPKVHIKQFQKKRIIRIILEEYFFAILTGDLQINLFGEAINQGSFEELSIKYEVNSPNKEKISFLIDCLTTDKIYKANSTEWYSSAHDEMNAEVFTESDLSEMKSLMAKNKFIGIELPIIIAKRCGSETVSHIKVFLKRDDKLSKTEELYVRRSLVLGKEKFLKNAPGKYFGLMLAQDDEISSMLAQAENASHMALNSQSRELKESFQNGADCIARVRHSLPQAARLLTSYQGIDRNALANLISITKPKTTPSKPSLKPSIKPKPLPPSQPKIRPFLVQQAGGEIKISKNPHYTNVLPKEIIITLAYVSGLGVGNAFSNWNSFDFDLTEKKNYPVKTDQMEINDRAANSLSLKVTGDTPWFSISGFSEFTPLVVSLEEVE